MTIFSLPGKLAPATLAELLRTYHSVDEQVLVGPEIGVDAAVLDLKGQILVATSDPITFASDEIGYYAVHVNANDIAVMGGVPRWFLVTLLLPVGNVDRLLVEKIFREIQEVCRSLGISVVGGHTEVTCGIDRPIVCGHMLGEAPPGKWVSSKGAGIGDVVILTKRLCIEGTSLIARERGDKALARGVPAQVVERARDFLHRPGISVLRDAQAALQNGCITSMHDPTEGGLSGGVYELAQAAGVGILVEAEAVRTYPETDLLCEAFGLDPLGLIASGSLLLTVPPENANAVLGGLSARGVEAAIVGRVTPRETGVRLKRGDQVVGMPAFEQDEIGRLLAGGRNGSA